jgi:hypothetical protein
MNELEKTKEEERVVYEKRRALRDVFGNEVEIVDHSDNSHT